MAKNENKMILKKGDYVLLAIFLFYIFAFIYSFVNFPNGLQSEPWFNQNESYGFLLVIVFLLFMVLLIAIFVRVIKIITKLLERNKKRGSVPIGGWLLAFVITIVLNLMIQIPSVIYGLINHFSAVGIIYLLISITLYLAFLFLVFNKNKSAPKKIILVIWVMVISDLIYGLITVMNTQPSPDVSSGALYVGLIIGSLVEIAVAYALTQYFNKSKRVKKTFVK